MEIERQLSLRAFARYAGVSPSTASRVFTRPDMVAADTREHVLKMARRSGFRPSPVARAAVGGDTRSVGVLLPDLGVSFFADIARGVQNGLLGEDYLPVVLTNANDAGLRAVQRLLDHRVDALILAISDESVKQSEIVALSGPDFPLVLVDQPHPGFSYDSVLSDDDGGGYEAGRHLLALGHRRIGFTRYGEGASNCDLRQAGFCRALAEQGCTLAPGHIAQLPAHPSEDDGLAALGGSVRRILAAPSRPSAFFASTDLHARVVLSVARNLGLRVPQDLSVVGFADLTFAELIDPPLTTIRQNGEEIGFQAAELIMSRLAEPKRERRRMVVPTRLVVRASTAVPAGG